MEQPAIQRTRDLGRKQLEVAEELQPETLDFLEETLFQNFGNSARHYRSKTSALRNWLIKADHKSLLPKLNECSPNVAAFILGACENKPNLALLEAGAPADPPKSSAVSETRPPWGVPAFEELPRPWQPPSVGSPTVQDEDRGIWNVTDEPPRPNEPEDARAGLPEPRWRTEERQQWAPSEQWDFHIRRGGDLEEPGRWDATDETSYAQTTEVWEPPQQHWPQEKWEQQERYVYSHPESAEQKNATQPPMWQPPLDHRPSRQEEEKRSWEVPPALGYPREPEQPKQGTFMLGDDDRERETVRPPYEENYYVNDADPKLPSKEETLQSMTLNFLGQDKPQLEEQTSIEVPTQYKIDSDVEQTTAKEDVHSKTSHLQEARALFGTFLQSTIEGRIAAQTDKSQKRSYDDALLAVRSALAAYPDTTAELANVFDRMLHQMRERETRFRTAHADSHARVLRLQEGVATVLESVDELNTYIGAFKTDLEDAQRLLVGL